MPLYGKNRFADEKKNPTTKAEYRESIIAYMEHSGDLAQRSERIPPHNPDRLPEMSMSSGKHTPKRMWTVAQEMVRDGIATLTNGSFESGSIYIVAGPNWEQRREGDK